jgi:hypothetical protein
MAGPGPDEIGTLKFDCAVPRHAVASMTATYRCVMSRSRRPGQVWREVMRQPYPPMTEHKHVHVDLHAYDDHGRKNAKPE